MLDNIRDGLTIFIKYADSEVEAAHDELLVLTRSPVSEEDAKALEGLDWHFKEDEKCWGYYT